MCRTIRLHTTKFWFTNLIPQAAVQDFTVYITPHVCVCYIKIQVLAIVRNYTFFSSVQFWRKTVDISSQQKNKYTPFFRAALEASPPNSWTHVAKALPRGSPSLPIICIVLATSSGDNVWSKMFGFKSESSLWFVHYTFVNGVSSKIGIPSSFASVEDKKDEGMPNLPKKTPLTGLYKSVWASKPVGPHATKGS